MNTTVLELIRAALNTTNVLFAGEDPDANTAKDALFHLNSMLDSWTADSLAIYAERNDVFALTPGQATYTVGPTGAWVMPRPVEIVAAQVRVSASIEYPMDIISNVEYNSIRVKGLTNSVQYAMGVQYSYPNASVSFYPTPSTDNPVRLTSRVHFAQLTNMTEIVDLPPGYQEAIVYNLAHRIATGMNKPLSQAAQEMQISSLARVKANNTVDTQLVCGDILGRSGQAWNPQTGYWARA